LDLDIWVHPTDLLGAGFDLQDRGLGVSPVEKRRSQRPEPPAFVDRHEEMQWGL
jgi:hypothetical protein